MGPRLPIVAIVGRPNVGKSTLFNRILGGRHAIVEDRARTTRDRLYGDAEWNGRRFVVVDTGGLEVDPDDPIEARVQEQARIAIAEADVIVFVVDAMTGATPPDLEAAELLRRTSSPVLVAVNKADNDKRELDAAEFYALGWDETYPISAAHGRGTGDLLDAIVWALPPETPEELARKAREAEAEEWARDVASGFLEPFVVGSTEVPVATPDGADERAEDEDETDAAGVPLVDDEARRWDAAMAAEGDGAPVAIAIVGRPNVGKSSLLNSLLGEERSIVSAVPGTTRDAIDTTIAWGRGEVVLIDTAGMRRRGKVAGGPAAERYSALRALKAIGRADVAILVLDAVDGLTAQDAHVAGYVVEEGRGLVIAINKWDLLAEKTDRTFDEYVASIRREVPFLDFAPVVSVSAKTGQRVGRVLEAAVDIWGERRKRITTGELNRIVGEATPTPAAAGGQGQAPEDLLRDPGRGRAPDLRGVRPGCRERPLQLPALSREPAARGARLRRHPDPSRVPRAQLGRAAPSTEGRRRRRPRRDARRRHGHPQARSGGEGEPTGVNPPPGVAIVGSGAWGTTLAILAARREPAVLVARSEAAASQLEATRENSARLPGIPFPARLIVTGDASVLAEVALVVFAVPSSHLRSEVGRVAGSIPAAADIVSVTKGLEAGTLLRMSQVVAEAGRIDPARIAALSGPNLALEIARGLPASAVVAATDPAVAERVRARLARRRFRLYVNSDIVGVELCGALKNVIAIAAGAVDELGFGDNGKAGLMTRGLAEMTRLGIAAGANPLTFAGLAGIGDVIATCGSALSRNHRLGVELARGRSWAELETALPGVAEGAYTVDAAIALAERLGVEMPIAREVHRALFEGKSVKRCLVDLLSRESKDELADYRTWMAGLETG